jgi:hypothetical protein
MFAEAAGRQSHDKAHATQSKSPQYHTTCAIRFATHPGIRSRHRLTQCRHVANLYALANGRRTWLVTEKDHTRRSGKRGRIHLEGFQEVFGECGSYLGAALGLLRYRRTDRKSCNQTTEHARASTVYAAAEPPRCRRTDRKSCNQTTEHARASAVYAAAEPPRCRRTEHARASTVYAAAEPPRCGRTDRKSRSQTTEHARVSLEYAAPEPPRCGRTDRKSCSQTTEHARASTVCAAADPTAAEMAVASYAVEGMCECVTFVLL